MEDCKTWKLYIYFGCREIGSYCGIISENLDGAINDNGGRFWWQHYAYVNCVENTKQLASFHPHKQWTYWFFYQQTSEKFKTKLGAMRPDVILEANKILRLLSICCHGQRRWSRRYKSLLFQFVGVDNHMYVVGVDNHMYVGCGSSLS